jgi:hypothetical protein
MIEAGIIPPWRDGVCHIFSKETIEPIRDREASHRELINED